LVAQLKKAKAGKSVSCLELTEAEKALALFDDDAIIEL
jgi:hypothetical protein